MNEQAKFKDHEPIKVPQFRTEKSGRPVSDCQQNVKLGMQELGVVVRYNEFADVIELTGLEGFGPTLEDAALDRLWLLIDEKFRFRPSKDFLRTIVTDTARRNSFHPVLDYLDSLTWDGVERIDRWLIDYAGAEDTPYVRAVGRLMLLAAVRRVRHPGTKFDEMVVLESPTQGTDKSTALATLAVNEEWFCDSLPLNADNNRVIETLRGRWIIEAGELSGMRKADVEHLKAFLSRQVDRGRLAYDRVVSQVRRQVIIIGTTNSEEYLRDTTGNRRFWPVRVKGFDTAALKRDVDLLWAEASLREGGGGSIRLDPALWTAAGEVQAERLTADPYYDRLAAILGHITHGKITSEDVWVILGSTNPVNRTQDMNNRLGNAMRRLGWQRPSKSGLIKAGGKNVLGYVIGEAPRPRIYAHTDSHDRFVLVSEEKDWKNIDEM